MLIFEGFFSKEVYPKKDVKINFQVEFQTALFYLVSVWIFIVW